MTGKNEINSEKILIKDVFKMWFRIPEYQRPYVWGKDQINDLLDDITYAMTERPDSQYFLGAFVFQKRVAGSTVGQKYDENDLIDGQQRLITLLLLFAVMRDLTTDPMMRTTCHQRVYQESNPYENQPEQIRITFEPGVRKSASEFFNAFVKNQNGTTNTQQIAEFVNCNCLFPACQSKLSLRLLTGLQVFDLDAFIGLKADELDIVCFEHRVYRRTDLDLHDVPVDSDLGNMLLDRCIRSICNELFHWLSAALRGAPGLFINEQYKISAAFAAVK